VIVNRCVINLAASMSSYHESGIARAVSLSDKAKILGVEDPTGMQRKLEQMTVQWKKKQQELESFQFSNHRRQDAEKELIHEGWLWKRSSNVIRDWKKRFFQIANGQLVYYRNLNKEVVCDVQLCTVREVPRTSGREAPPPRSSFEVISNKRALVLMASSEEDKEVWVAAIRRAMEKCLLLDSSSVVGRSLSTTTSESMSDLHDDVSNHRCFECKVPLDTLNWVSINLGIFICIGCSGVHRSLGTHISKVRSLSFDKLPSSQLDILRRLGNARAAKIWEAKVDCAAEREKGMNFYVREKYVSKAFLAETDVDNTMEAFETVLIENNLKRVAWFVAHGKPPFYLSPKVTALHVAASEPTTSAALCEFLLLNGAELAAQDELGRTPFDIANEKNSTKAQAVFRSWAATSHVKGALADDV